MPKQTPPATRQKARQQSNTSGSNENASRTKQGHGGRPRKTTEGSQSQALQPVANEPQPGANQDEELTRQDINEHARTNELMLGACVYCDIWVTRD